MFTKLLKHDWKSNSRLLGVLSLAALGVGVLAAVLLRLEIHVASRYYDASNYGQEIFANMLSVLLVMVLLFLVLALVAYGLGTEIILLHRFYKSRFTDQGYLTFTLPVNSHQIFLSGWLNMLAWTAISVAVVMASALIALLLGLPWERGDLKYFAENMGQITFIYSDIYGAGYTTLTVLGQVVSFLTEPVIALTCITLGAVFAKKHKILMAIGIYYLYTLITSTVGTVISTMVTMSMLTSDAQTLLYTASILQILLDIGLAVLGYFLSTYMMRNKLNLP